MRPNEERTLDEVRDALDQGGYTYVPTEDGLQLRAQCPGHNGSKPNAWFREAEGTNGKTYVNVTCWSEGEDCDDVAIYAALTLATQGLLRSTKEFVKPKNMSRGGSSGAKLTREEWLACQFSGFDMDTMEVKTASAYLYKQYNGEALSTKQRLQAYDKTTGERVLTDQKSFQWWPKRASWPSEHPPLYRGRALVQVLKDLQDGEDMPARYDDVYACEGEKAVDTAAFKDLLAVCGHTGCNTKLQPADLGLLKAYTEATGGAVVVVRDLDAPGAKGAAHWADKLTAWGIRFRVVVSATGEPTHDLHDHLEAGHGPEDLVDVSHEYSTTSVSAR